MNNKIRKTILSTLSVTVLCISSATVTLANTEGTPLPMVQTIMTDADKGQVKPSSHYISVKGTIQEISNYGENNEMQLVTVTTATGDINRFVISDETFASEELAVGTEILAFYDANVPVIMIYPPQYKAIAIALADSGRTVKVDLFDENLTSADGTLKLNISDETNIIYKDGTAYTGDLTNHDLIVSYGPSTRSIPAQTTPEQIVVLSDRDDSAGADEGDAQDQKQGPLTSVSGIIQDITEFAQEDAANKQLISIKTNDNEPIDLIVSDTTYVDEELAKDTEIVAFYNTNAPMTMIYPPRYHAEAVALVKSDRSVMVDRFDETLLNSGKSLRLNITDATKVVTQDGNAFEGDLADRKLFVEYQAVALSLPGQTTPTRIIILDEQGTAAIQENTDESPAAVVTDLQSLEDRSWMVNDQLIAAPSAYIGKDEIVMVPLRAVTEALGYELTWESDTMTVRIGKAASLQIGKDDYHLARMSPIQLGAAPELVDGLTYVPLSFFKEVIRAEKVSIDAEQIVIQE